MNIPELKTFEDVLLNDAFVRSAAQSGMSQADMIVHLVNHKNKILQKLVDMDMSVKEVRFIPIRDGEEL